MSQVPARARRLLVQVAAAIGDEQGSNAPDADGVDLKTRRVDKNLKPSMSFSMALVARLARH